MAITPRILTFNFHEPYLCLMAKTGYRIFVGEYNEPPLARAWQTRYRPVPKNVILLEESVWQRDLMNGKFDVLIAHNETNALNVYAAPCPKLLVCHNRKTFLVNTAAVPPDEARERFHRLLEKLNTRFGFVFISESKRDDYGVPGRVILPGIDVEEYGGYAGEEGEIMRVGNMMRERNLMFDLDFQDLVCRGLPNQVVGDNPTIPGAKAAASFEELLGKFRRLRCLLHVTREDWEDGYNLAMLEAMACGMPVVSLANRTSPLTDGEDGFVSCDSDVLRKHARTLLEDVDLARRIGGRGRETVAEKFPLAAFVDKWREAIETAAEQSPRLRVPPKAAPRPAAKRLNLLLHYLCSPLTTGRYMEWAARKLHNVVTAGFRCPEDVLTMWGFSGAIPAYPPHQIDLPLKSTYQELVEGIPAGFKPDVYFWIDSGPKEVPSDIHSLKMPRACYLIDTHIAPELRLAMARHFDFTFLAQKAQVPHFIEAGIPNVAWMPLACSPELHDVGSLERVYDVSFICNPRGDHSDRRRGLLEGISTRFPNSLIGQFWPEEMARAYAQSKIVVNACINRDVNMRVFEALASGALLITDEADGLEDLFEDGKHLVVYRKDDDLFPVIEKCLADEEARRRIADAGRALVYEKHTYAHRITEMLHVVIQGQPRMATGREDARFLPGGYYRMARPEIVAHVPRVVQRLLDVGCGAGDLGRELKKRGVREVVGIEMEPQACAMAKQVLDDAIEGNVEHMALPFDDGYFDCITFADVLEHLVDPVAVLRKTSRVLAPDGIMIMSIPNVRFYEVVQMLANGYWSYQDAGIMDQSHLRFFTASEIRKAITQAGLALAHLAPLSFFPEQQLPLNPNGTLSLHRLTIGPLSEEEYREFLTYQYVAIAGIPNGDRLAKARRELEARENETAYQIAQEAYGVDEADRKGIMARALARLGKLDGAETLYKELLRMNPDDTAIQGDLGILYVAMSRNEEAKPYLERAAAHGPGSGRALGALGLVRFSNGELEAAFDCLKEAAAASFENAGLVSHLIEVAGTLGRLEEIEELVRRFVEFYPGNVDLAYNHAVLLAQSDRVADAREHLEALLVLFPDHGPARQLLERLEGPER